MRRTRVITTRPDGGARTYRGTHADPEASIAVPDLSHPHPEAPREIIIPDIGDLADTYEAALIYAEAGVHILPVRRGVKDVSSIVGRGWPERASTDTEVIRHWLYGKDRSIGAHAGPSGLVVLDVDRAEFLPSIFLEAIGDLKPPHQASRVNSRGRGHYCFAQPPGHRIGNKQGSFTPAGDVRGWNGGVVLAPSVHPEPDGYYHWIRTGRVPVLPPELVLALGYGMEESATPRGTPSPRPLSSKRTLGVAESSSHSEPLPREIQYMIRTGVKPSRFGSRSEARQAVATACVRAGFSKDEYCDLLSDESNGAYEWYAKDPNGGSRNGRPLMKRDYEKAKTFVAERLSSTSPEDIQRTLRDLKNRATRHSWTGRNGSRNRQVFLALVDHALQQGSISVQVSARQAGELAGVTKDTANRAINDLLTQGLLVRLARGDRQGYAATYRFDASRLARIDHPGPTTPCMDERPRIDDYWAKVGPIASRVYELVSEGPRSAIRIATVTGHHVSTVRRHLRRLGEDGLVWQGADGVWGHVEVENLPAWTEQLAREYGWSGHLERQREDHRAQRLARVDYTDPTLLPRLLPEIEQGQRPGWAHGRPTSGHRFGMTVRESQIFMAELHTRHLAGQSPEAATQEDVSA